MTAPDLVLTKLHPPAVPAEVVGRDRLLDLLSGAADRLTVVACPAGSGKTTLLADWRRREASVRPVAWLSLDEGDRDAIVLWAHVIAALDQAAPGLAAAAGAERLAAAPLVETALPRLVNALVAASPIALILDDFHRLGPGPAHDSVAWFVEHAPASVQIVVASRTDPGLPLGTLRARRRLLEVRTDALAFTELEAATFLNDGLGLDLEPEDVALLVARTEGWPAGLYLAALVLEGAPDRRALVAQFDGTSAHVVDFLGAEVLAAAPPDLQDFMVRTSVLERLCAPLCDAVLQTDGSADALERLARTNLFLIPLDDRRAWFRFHHLFAQILRRELDRRERRLAPELHRRAAAWHAASGTPDEAIHHAVAAGAYADASALIAEHWNAYANAGRTASVVDWLELIPEEVLQADAQSLVVRAWAMALVGREADMRGAIARAGTLGGLDAGPTIDGFASLESSISVLTAAFGWGDVGAILEHGARSLELEGPESPLRPIITWSLGWGHYCAGNLDEAERWLRETAEIGPASDQWIVGLGAMADLALIAGARGDRDLQLRLATETRELTIERGLIEAIEDGEVHTSYGAALAAHGRAEEALPHLEQGVFLRRLWRQPLDLADGLLALAPTVAALGGYERAAAILDEVDELLGRCPDPGAFPARLAAARRRLVDAALSEREREILRLLGSGLSEREIGERLYISFNTVHSHVKSVYRKLGTTTRAQAVARAVHLGDSPPDG